MRIHARHYATLEAIEIERDDGRIMSIRPTLQASETLVAPALFDLQINGAFGFSFNSPRLTLDEIRRVIDCCRSHGIGGMLPTLVTTSHDAFIHGFTTLANARRVDPLIGRTVAGYHLEGPHLSPDDGPRGAHPREHIRPPDWDEFSRFQEAAGGLIKLVTLAPEHDGAIPFIEKAVDSGVVVAIGHTAASSAQIRNAIRAGARLSTHLGNGSHAMLPRHDNYIWEQLAADELWASIIPDGHHLPGGVLKSIYRVKSAERLIITCDASSLAGLPPGRYAQWGTELEVQPGGKVVVPDTPFLAGSGMFTDECIGPMMQMTGASLQQAIDMATVQPRKLLGLPHAGLAVGSTEPLMLFTRTDAGIRMSELID